MAPIVHSLCCEDRLGACLHHGQSPNGEDERVVRSKLVKPHTLWDRAEVKELGESDERGLMEIMWEDLTSDTPGWAGEEIPEHMLSESHYVEEREVLVSISVS